MNKKITICKNCVMDTTDSKIVFDQHGVCDHCNNYYNNILPKWKKIENNKIELTDHINKIKNNGKNSDYDCLIGISGGVDSSYLTYLAKEIFKLRPLIFHVDGGWNSQQAVNNIENLVKKLDLDLYTEVINWSEMKDLQLAFFKAQVPTLDTPQDHAFFSSMYNFAVKNNIKYILTGANYSTECIREPLEWNYHTSDLSQLKDIHSKFGKLSLSTFPTSDILTYKVYYRIFKGIRVFSPLNYVNFNKEKAIKILQKKFDWQKYEHKHYESRFTKFYEGYWLCEKFGFDKRKAHFSSLILTNQMTREEALKKLSKPAFNKNTIKDEFSYIASKLDITSEELHAIMNGENRSYKNYKNKSLVLSVGTYLSRMFGLYRGIIR